MKRLISVLLILLLLTSCSKSVPINIDIFEKEINEAFNKEIFNSQNTYTIEKDDQLVTYWIPENMGIYCVIHQNKSDRIIKKYSLCSKENNKLLSEFNEKFYITINNNNTFFDTDEFTSDGYRIIVYEDKRYKKEEHIPTLKKEITDFDMLIN